MRERRLAMASLVPVVFVLLMVASGPVNALANSNFTCKGDPTYYTQTCLQVIGSGTYIDHVYIRLHTPPVDAWSGSVEMWVQPWGQDTNPFQILNNVSFNYNQDWTYNWYLYGNYPSASGHSTEVCVAPITQNGYVPLPYPACVYSPW